MITLAPLVLFGMVIVEVLPAQVSAVPYERIFSSSNFQGFSAIAGLQIHQELAFRTAGNAISFWHVCNYVMMTLWLFTENCPPSCLLKYACTLAFIRTGRRLYSLICTLD